MNELLFHVQWWIPALLAVIGVALFINGNKVQVDRLRNAGVAIVLVALVWGIVSYLVDTDQEKVENGTRNALAAVVAGKWDAFQGKLGPGAQFTINGSSVATGPEDVTQIARNGAETIKLTSARIQDMTLEQHGTFIIAHIDIFSMQDAFRPIETSTWDFEWQLTPQGWKLHDMRLIKLKDVDNMNDAIPKGITNLKH